MWGGGVKGSARAGGIDGFEQTGAIAGIADKINVARIYDEERRFVIVMEEIGIGRADLFQVVGVKHFFKIATALFDLREQDIKPCLQVNDEVRAGDLGLEQRIDALIERQFIGIERQPREDAIFGEKIIGDSDLIE